MFRPRRDALAILRDLERAIARAPTGQVRVGEAVVADLIAELRAAADGA